MRREFYTILTFIIITGLFSCSDEYRFNDIANPSKIVIQSEVKANVKSLFAFVSTSMDINGNGGFEKPTDAICTVELLERSGVVLEVPKVIELLHTGYEGQKYAADGHSDYVPQYGDHLRMKTHIQDASIGDVVAETRIPFPIKNFISEEEIIIEDIEDGYKIKINSTLDFSGNENTGFLKVSAKVGYRKYEEIEGEIVFLGTETRKQLGYSVSDNDKYAALIKRKKGVYLNLREQRQYTITMSTKEGLVIPGNCILTSINYEYTSISEDIYRFDISVEKNINAQNSPYVEPIVSHTNISNGIGVFGSSSSTVSVVSLLD